jgi:hypothetical protein
MNIVIFDKYKYKQSIEKVYHKLYNNLGYSICIDPYNKANNVYFWIGKYCLVFKELSVSNEIDLESLNSRLELLNPKTINTYAHIKDYVLYIIDYYKINGLTIELFNNPKNVRVF